jgi:hypothetical protein
MSSAGCSDEQVELLNIVEEAFENAVDCRMQGVQDDVSTAADLPALLSQLPTPAKKAGNPWMTVERELPASASRNEPSSASPWTRPPAASRNAVSKSPWANVELSEDARCKDVASVSAATVTAKGMTDKVGQGIGASISKTKEIAAKHQVTSRTADAGRSAISRTKEIEEKHSITARTADAGRAAAACTAEAGRAAVYKAKGIEAKYQVTTRTADAGRTAISKAKEFEENHKVTARTAGAGRAAISKTKEFEAKHDVAARTADAGRKAYQATRNTTSKAQEWCRGRSNSEPNPFVTAPGAGRESSLPQETATSNPFARHSPPRCASTGNPFLVPADRNPFNSKAISA